MDTLSAIHNDVTVIVIKTIIVIFGLMNDKYLFYFCLKFELKILELWKRYM